MIVTQKHAKIDVKGQLVQKSRNKRTDVHEWSHDLIPYRLGKQTVY